MERKDVVFPLALSFLFLITTKPCASQVQPDRLPNSEVTLLKQIGKSLGKYWNFTVNPCSGERGWTTISPNTGSATYEDNVICSCPENETVCHVQKIVLKGQGLAGKLPRELAGLRFLDVLDLSRNYLNGSIPKEWGSMRLCRLTLMSNRLSGSIPKELASITTLRELNLEGNMFTGKVPPELGNLTNLTQIVLSSNNFSGELPTTFIKLTKMMDLRISSNNFTGKIPDYIASWKSLKTLIIQGTALEGPFPQIYSWEDLSELAVSDLHGTFLEFPNLNQSKKLVTLIIRNCKLSGQLPYYISELSKLSTLDLSFNNLIGDVPSSFKSLNLDFLTLTSNNLTGPMPYWIPRQSKHLDFSYNNFTNITSGETPDCTQGNLVESVSKNMQNQDGINACLRKDFPCEDKKPKYSSLYINCGSTASTRIGTTVYEKDAARGGYATLFVNQNWAFSNTGKILHTNDTTYGYIATNSSMLNTTYPELYKTARLSPLSLKYYGLCLFNGNYTVKLHFAEIIITDDKNFTSLGRRIFDIYIQGKLVQKDFNIKEAAKGSNKDFILNFTAEVSVHTLEIHLFWAGKGTTAIPYRGVYGPLISAITIDANFKPPEDEEVLKKWRITIGIAIGLPSFIILTLLILTILWKKGSFLSKQEKELRGQVLQIGSFSLRQIKSATNNFDSSNKIGEGGFGPVYKGKLSDGTVIAVKQLSSKSTQGNREFVNEIAMISALRHPNLVNLYGCCIDGHQLHLVYEYMENNSLARALFGREDERLKLDWPTRNKICIGMARGLAHLHEESLLKIVHRDIKSTNILLDKDLNAKISDFGLARLEEDGHTHISTKIAGTIGYMAPEYVMYGHLTYKADVYSFGVVALEIVSGKSNHNFEYGDEGISLLDLVSLLHNEGNLLDIVDPELDSKYSKEEVLTVLKVTLLCINSSPSLRPTMSTVVRMLEGKTNVHSPLQSPKPSNAELDDCTIFFLGEHSERSENDLTGSSESAAGYSNSNWLPGNSSDDLYPVDLYPVYGTNSI